jgi:hypothetical protein
MSNLSTLALISLRDLNGLDWNARISGGLFSIIRSSNIRFTFLPTKTAVCLVVLGVAEMFWPGRSHVI